MEKSFLKIPRVKTKDSNCLWLLGNLDGWWNICSRMAKVMGLNPNRVKTCDLKKKTLCCPAQIWNNVHWALLWDTANDGVSNVTEKEHSQRAINLIAWPHDLFGNLPSCWSLHLNNNGPIIKARIDPLVIGGLKNILIHCPLLTLV